MPWQTTAVEAARKVAQSKAAQSKTAKAAGTFVAGVVGKEAQERVRGGISSRGHRRLAIDLARQVKGKYSAGTVVAGKRRYVVWKDGKPIDCFPPIDGKLADRWELQDFNTELLRDPRVERRSVRRQK
jgi:hypothetical protein